MTAYEVIPFLSCIHRLERAHLEGSAKYKLRLMARILNGQMEVREIIADEFVSFAALIESLRKEEVILAAANHRLEQKYLPAGDFDRLNRELTETLIPRIFADADEMTATAAALQRTGLMVGRSGFGGIVYRCGPLMNRFAKLARLENIDADNL